MEYKLERANGTVELMDRNRAMDVLLSFTSDRMAGIIDQEMRWDGKVWHFGGNTKETIHKISYIGAKPGMGVRS